MATVVVSSSSSSFFLLPWDTGRERERGRKTSYAALERYKTSGSRYTRPQTSPLDTPRRTAVVSAQHTQTRRSTEGHEMMPTTQTVCVLVLLLSTLPLFLGHPTIIERAEQRSECEGCGEDCDKCKYGSAFSRWCGLRECLKGPGEMCGGVRNKYGACGEGMYCRCNKCTGCSIDTLECFSGFCPVYEQMQLRHPEHMQGLQLDK